MFSRYRPSCTTLLLSAVCIALIDAPASAYVDPATSGLAMQILAPVLIALATFWRSIKAKLTALLAWLGGRRLPPKR